MFSHDATIEFEYESDREASIVAESVGVEVGEIEDDRSRSTVSRRGGIVEVTVRARDVTALRAAANTWFSLVDVAETAGRLGSTYDRGESRRSGD